MAERPKPKSPSISTTPEDAVARRRPGPGGRRRAGGDGSGTGRMIGINLILAVLVAGLVVAGWFIANQHQLLKDEQHKVASANTRIEALENRLMATDAVMTEAGAETDEQINLWESEIRKLWAISNERNKKWIEDNQKSLARQKGTISSLESNDKTLKSAVDRHERAFAQQQAVIDQLASIELQLQQILRGQRDLVDKVNVASQSVASMATRVADNEQAVAAIDAYRLQINSRLSTIERRLDTTTPTL